MPAEVLLDVEIARGFHVDATVAVPDDTRGIVACVSADAALAQACTERGFAVVQVHHTISPEDVDRSAAIFADVVTAVVADRAIFGRPIGYFGADLGGAAALVAASMHTNDVAAVVTLNAPLHMVGPHLSGLRSAALFLVDTDEQLERASHVLPALPGGSTLVQRADGDVALAAADWFDHSLRGVMRGARRELWRSA